MTQFAYKARDASGTAVTGTHEAPNALDVAGHLKTLGYHVIAIDLQAPSLRQAWGRLKARRPVPPAALILLTRQLATMLRAGLPLTTALASAGTQATHPVLRAALQTILRDVEAGQPLSQACARHSNMFPNRLVSLMRVGETTGNLEEVLERLAQLLEGEEELRQRVVTALIYPACVVAVAFVIITLILVYVIPKFMGIFATYDVPLPWTTRLLLGVSALMQWGWWLLPVGAVAGARAWQRARADAIWRQRLDAQVLRLPLVGPFLIQVAVARLARTLGLLARSGVPILEALDVATETLENRVLEQAVQRIRQQVTEGEALAKAFEQSRLFPPMVIQMIALGERSGQLEAMLAQLAVYYDQETAQQVKRFTALLEPLLLLILGAFVAFVALSILVPIFSLVKLFRQG